MVRAQNGEDFHIFTVCRVKGFLPMRSGPTVTARGRYARPVTRA